MVKMNAPSASWTAPQVTPELYEGIAQGTPRTCASFSLYVASKGNGRCPHARPTSASNGLRRDSQLFLRHFLQ